MAAGSMAVCSSSTSFLPQFTCRPSLLLPLQQQQQQQQQQPSRYRPSLVLTRAQGQQQQGGESDESKAILNAFFVGKAFADAVNERVGSALGEFLSDLGRKQAQQQKEIRQFQEEVQERARAAMAESGRRLRSEHDSPPPPTSSPAARAAPERTSSPPPPL